MLHSWHREMQTGWPTQPQGLPCLQNSRHFDYIHIKWIAILLVPIPFGNSKIKRQIFDTLGNTEVISYVEGNRGSSTCRLGSPIMTSKECKTACGTLNKKMGAINDGQPCYIAGGGGRCKQDGKRNRNTWLVCKIQGNTVICTLYKYHIGIYFTICI